MKNACKGGNLDRFWGWMREIEGFIRLIWQLLERFFETVQQIKGRKYASWNVKRLLGYPVWYCLASAAPGWTACGREPTDNHLIDLV
jgi:hypothetical protein